MFRFEGLDGGSEGVGFLEEGDAGTVDDDFDFDGVGGYAGLEVLEVGEGELPVGLVAGGEGEEDFVGGGLGVSNAEEEGAEQDSAGTVWAGSWRNLMQGFLGEEVEGLDGLGEVVFVGVFQGVVAKASETLDEEHDRRDAGAGDFGGVVEGAGGEVRGLGGLAFGIGDFMFVQDLLDCLGGELDEGGVEGYGFDGPDALPVDGAAFFGGKALAGGDGFGVHLGEDFGVEVAHVEGGFTAADDGGDDAGEGFDRAHGGYGVGVSEGDGADLEGEFGGGAEGVVAGAHGGGARVRFLPVEGDGVALDALGAGDDGEGKSAGLEDGALLDVKLEVGGGVFLLDGGVGDLLDPGSRTGQWQLRG